jgi:DNA-binding MarR family transcriptional regulator
MVTIGDYCRKNQEDDFKGFRVSRLAKMMDMTIPTTSKLLRVIEGKGYAQRILDDNDRRVVYICLTPKGTEIISKSYEEAINYAQRMLDKLGDDDSAELMRILNKLFAIVREDISFSTKSNLEEGSNL